MIPGEPEPISVQFTVGGAERNLTFSEWALALGIYNPSVVAAPGFLDVRGIPDDWYPHEFWSQISSDPWESTIRESMLRDPFHRYIHRLIANTICGRGESTEVVT